MELLALLNQPDYHTIAANAANEKLRRSNSMVKVFDYK